MVNAYFCGFVIRHLNSPRSFRVHLAMMHKLCCFLGVLKVSGRPDRS